MAEITDQNFLEELDKSAKPVLVDFFTDWCPPCSQLAPILESVAEEFDGKIELLKVNLDNIPLIAKKLEIDRIPTVILFEKGEPKSGFVGLRPESLVKEWLSQALAEKKVDEVDRLIGQYEDYARENGFKLNPDKELVKKLVIGILENKKKYGEKYCPCRRITGNSSEDRPKICPCQWHKEEIEKEGHCLCGLFQK